MICFARTTTALALSTFLVSTAGDAAESITLDRPVLSLAAARTIIAAAEAEAAARGVGVVTVVVDSSGAVIALSRMDAAQVASVSVGIGKARTAAIYRRPSRDFEEQIRNGRVAALALADATPLQGGVPVFVNGTVVGAVGVSGDTPRVDEEIAIAGAEALEGSARPESPTQVTYLPASRVNASFVKGEPLLETAAYKVHASFRDAPGRAEVHQRDTDIIYVLEGAATIVTGGAVVDGSATAVDEIRGSAIRGGEQRQLAKGDVFIVPNGVPHWFTSVRAPFRYYVVKATSAEGGVR
jgi:glc operon protein GlcG